MERQDEPRTMKVFFIVWIGQLISTVGSSLTVFALGLWVYQATASVAAFAFIGFCRIVPVILLSPVAGSLVDRWDRRRLMIIGDTGAALASLSVAFLFLAGRLEVWQVYAAAFATALFGTFQTPAFMAATYQLVPKAHLGRANGMLQIGQAASEIIAPTLAGALVVTIQMGGIALIDVVTFLAAILAVLMVRFPPVQAVDLSRGKYALVRDTAAGFRFIAACPGLLGLLTVFAYTSFMGGMIGALLQPMILNFASAGVLGVLLSVAGGGFLIGSLVMSLWGGPQPRIIGVLGFGFLCGACVLLIGVRAWAPMVAVAAFGAHVTIPIVVASNQAIWQSKIAAGAQGRVFGVRQTIVGAAQPLAFLIAGPLADRVFEPLLAENGLLAASVGQIIGTGPGRGMGLMFMLLGATAMLLMAATACNPRVRLIEVELPDNA